MFRDDIDVVVEPVTNPALDGMLSSPLFILRYSLFSSHMDGSAGYSLHVWIDDDRLIPNSGGGFPGTGLVGRPISFFDGLFNPDFRLNEASADQFLLLLKELTGDDFFERVEVDAIQNRGNKWYFLNDDFSDNYKGFIVTVDGMGAVVEVEYQLKAFPEQE